MFLPSTSLRHAPAAVRRRAGFTLVEILIVAAIIGLLSAIAIASMARIRRITRENICLNDLRVIGDAIDLLAFETGMWPGGHTPGEVADVEVWDLSAPRAGLVATDGRFPDWKGPYLRRVPRDPWGNHYFFDPDYFIGGDVYPVMGSFGPDGIGRNRYNADDIYVIMR